MIFVILQAPPAVHYCGKTIVEKNATWTTSQHKDKIMYDSNIVFYCSTKQWFEKEVHKKEKKKKKKEENRGQQQGH